MSLDLNFVDYLSRQEKNLLVSLVELHEEFRMFKIMDEILRQGIQGMVVPGSEDTLAELLLVCHAQFFGSISDLLRGRISEAFVSTRKAIDVAFTAYRLQAHPEDTEGYKSRDWSFRTIKKTISDRRKKHPSEYPLAEGLIEIHERCSQFAAHADYSGIEPRLESSADGKRIYHYFDHPKDHQSYRGLFLYMLAIYHQVFAIFSEFIAAKLVGDDGNWERAFVAIGARLGEAYREIGENET